MSGFRIVPRPVGANMSVEVCPPGGRSFNVLVPIAHPQRPRVDQIVAVLDKEGNRQIEYLEGAPTTGANFSNWRGLAQRPENSEHIAYVLVPAGATTIGHNNIHHDALEHAFSLLEV